LNPAQAVVGHGSSRPVASTRRSTRDALARTLESWIPQSIVEWAWWPVFAVCAFLPLSRTPVFRLGGMYITLTDFLLLLLALTFLPLALILRKRSRRAFRWAFLPFTALATYSLMTAFFWGDPPRYDFVYQIYPIVEAWVAMCVGFTLVVSLPRDGVPEFVRRLSYALAFVACVYIIVALFPPAGVREHVRIDPAFGIPRLSGPLGVPTDLPGIFVVAISYYVVGIRKIHQGLVRGALASLLVAAVLLCGSRAGGIALILLAATILIRRLSFKSKLVVIVASAVGAVVVFQFALPERYVTFEDSLRLKSYETAFVAWTDSWRALVFGHGYGQIWPWYAHDVHMLLGEDRYYHFLINTRFGVSVFNPHSVYLNLLAETGLLGFGLFAATVGSQVMPVLRWGTPHTLASRLMPGLLASLVTPAFSAMLLKYFALSTCWWMFFFAMVTDYSLHGQAVRRNKQ
jgi:hypothetical protein